MPPRSACSCCGSFREALTNVAQHGRATTVRVGLVFGTEGVAVIVEDDGVGFDVDAIRERRAGMGLPGLVARATQVAGRVHLESTPGWGTRIRADLPYQPTASQRDGISRWRILIVHEQPAMRAGLVHLLDSSEPGVQVVAEVDEIEAAVEAVQLLQPDVVLASTSLACPSGQSVVAHLRHALPDVAVIGILDGAAAEGELLSWAAAGARGFVPAEVDATGLGRAVVAAARGEALLSGGILEQLGGLPTLDAPRLTQRETEVRDLINEGLADKQIATRLGISVKTVEKHVGAVVRKTGVRSRTELLARV